MRNWLKRVDTFITEDWPDGVLIFIVVIMAMVIGCHRCSAQSWELINHYSYVVTDLKYDSSGREYVLRQQGSLTVDGDTIKVFQCKFQNESGAVSFDFADNGFYIHIGSPDNKQRVIRYDTVTGIVDTIITVPYLNPFSQVHRGGSVIYTEMDSTPILLVSFGDGGNSMSAQDLDDYRGKLLKIDLNTMTVDIVLFGLRNPFRLDYYPERGEGFITDVGDDIAEEVNYFRPEYSLLNLGWPCYSGDSLIVDSDTICGGYAFSFPEYSYSQSAPRAIIGGTYWRDEYYWADAYSGIGGSIDTLFNFTEFPILFPLGMTCATTNHLGELVIGTYNGDIYKYIEPPLGIDPPDPKPDPDLGNYWLRKYGDVYITLDGKVLKEYPTYTGLYYSFLFKKWIFIQ